MKLSCDTIIMKRENTIGGQKPKPSKSTLVIFRESKTKPIQLRVTSMVKSRMDFRLDNKNVDAIFSKMAEKGMTTVRFVEPPMDVMISKADLVQLGAFLKVFKLASTGGDLSALSDSISSQSQAATSQPKPAPTKLDIAHRRDYPFWTPIPSSLKQLGIRGCQLTEFDNRLLRLRSLESLVLTGNKFAEGQLDDISLASLTQLRSIDLSSNEIDHLSEKFCRELPPNLKLLHLSSNSIADLPDALFERTNSMINSLFVDRNRLTTLNKKIINWRSTLRLLFVNENQLTSVPSAIAKLTLDTANFSDNPFATVVTNGGSSNSNTVEDSERMARIPTLSEISARSIAGGCIPIDRLPPGLQAYVQYVRTLQCAVCKNISLPSRAKSEQCSFSLRSICSNLWGVRYATIEDISCSDACSKLFRAGKF